MSLTDDAAGHALEIVFERERCVATFELLAHQAPETISLLWEMLPLTVATHHCVAAGREVFALLPPFARVPPPENRALVPAAGDLWFIHLDGDFEVVPPGTNPSAETGIFDLAVWYGPDSWASTADGGAIGGTHIGRLVSSHAAFVAACEGIWLNGSDTATVRPQTHHAD